MRFSGKLKESANLRDWTPPCPQTVDAKLETHLSPRDLPYIPTWTYLKSDLTEADFYQPETS